MKLLLLGFILALALIGCASTDVESQSEPVGTNPNDISSGDLPPLPPAEKLESADPVQKTEPMHVEPIQKHKAVHKKNKKAKKAKAKKAKKAKMKKAAPPAGSDGQ